MSEFERLMTELVDGMNDIRRFVRQIADDQAEALDAKAYGRLLKVSESQIYNMNKDGRIPEPVTVGEKKGLRWSRAEAVAHGAPVGELLAVCHAATYIVTSPDGK